MPSGNNHLCASAATNQGLSQVSENQQSLLAQVGCFRHRQESRILWRHTVVFRVEGPQLPQRSHCSPCSENRLSSSNAWCPSIATSSRHRRRRGGKTVFAGRLGSSRYLNDLCCLPGVPQSIWYYI